MKLNQLFGIEDLANSDEFKEFFSIVRDITGVVTALGTPEGSRAQLLCEESEFSPICRVLRSTKEGWQACDETNRKNCKIAANEKHGIRYPCHAGLIDFLVPVYSEKRHIAIISGGQILPEKPTKKGFERLCERVKGIPCDKQDLQNAYFSSPYMTPKEIEAVFRLVSFFADYFCEMGTRLHNANQYHKYPAINEAKQYIQENFCYEISMSDVANHVGLSDSYFSRHFSKVCGITYSEYVSMLRLSEAKKLIAKTDWNITKIAFSSGFNNLSNFDQTFHKYENCSPSRYRKRFKQTKQQNSFKTSD